jgi:dihydrofolate reductase
MEAIYATDSEHGLAKDDIIPWKSKKDINFFLNKTLYNVVLMGRKTFFSIPTKHRPLRNRLNIVLTNNKDIQHTHLDNTIFTNDFNIYNTILTNKTLYNIKYPYLQLNFKIFVIGGKHIYEQFIPLCNKIWVTIIKHNYNCNLFFYYNFSNNFNKNIIDDDNELTIIEYTNNLI